MSGTFDPAHTGGGIALSNGNLTALATSTSLTMGTVGLVVDATQDVSFVYTHDNVTNSFRYGIGLTSLPTNALSPDMSTTAGAATAIQCTQGGNCNNSAGTRLATPSTSRPAVGSQTEIRLKNGKLYFRYRASSGAAWPSTYNGASGTYQNADPALDNGIPLTPNFPSGSIVVPIFSADNGGVTMDATNWAASGTTYSASVAESGAAADTVAAQATFAPAIAEAGAASDGPGSGGTFGKSVAETGAAADAPSARATFGSSVGETGAATSTQSAARLQTASVAEAGAAADTVSARATFARAVAESGSAAETVGRSVSPAPSPARTISIAQELRSMSVDPEIRLVAVDPEVRLLAVDPEVRSFLADAEVRTYPIAAESRVIFVAEADMANQSFNKDPDAILDYTVDWSAWLGTDTITTATWILDASLTQVSVSHTTTAATIFLSGGVNAGTPNVTCRIVTAGGRTEDRSFTLKVADR